MTKEDFFEAKTITFTFFDGKKEQILKQYDDFSNLPHHIREELENNPNLITFHGFFEEDIFAMSNWLESHKRLHLKMLAVSLFYWVLTGTAIGQPGNQHALSAKKKITLSKVTHGSPFERYSNLQVVASIDNVGNNQYEIVEFKLEQDRILRLYAIGEGVRAGMHDLGGIENAQTGQLVWVMHHLSTVHAGGAEKNRMVDRLLTLSAGTYRLHFKTDHAHSFDSWNDSTPDHNWWGIRLYDETAMHTELMSSF